jgi:catechol 2,3-dioxygenase-like lactoylglutathione lyase family enzyme
MALTGEPSMNLRLQHIAISRPPGGDAVARAFYGDVLGLPEISPPANLATLDLIWYRLAQETELHIMVEEPVGQDHSGRHFCLAVDDMMELRDRLEAAGITAVSDLPIPGRPRFFIRDPFGNLIEITSIEGDYLP